MSLNDFRKGNIAALILNVEKGGWVFAQREHDPATPIVNATFDESNQILSIELAEDKGTVQFNGTSTLYRSDRGTPPNMMAAYETRQESMITLPAIRFGGDKERTIQAPVKPIGYFCHIERTRKALALSKEQRVAREAAEKKLEVRRAEQSRQAQEREDARERDFTKYVQAAFNNVADTQLLKVTLAKSFGKLEITMHLADEKKIVILVAGNQGCNGDEDMFVNLVVGEKSFDLEDRVVNVK